MLSEKFKDRFVSICDLVALGDDYESVLEVPRTFEFDEFEVDPEISEEGGNICPGYTGAAVYTRLSRIATILVHHRQ